jgi:hypothetical protein
MSKSNLWTILVGIALVVLPYLLVQSDVTVPPLAKVVIQSAILAVGVVARYLPTEAAPPTQVLVIAILVLIVLFLAERVF